MNTLQQTRVNNWYIKFDKSEYRSEKIKIQNFKISKISIAGNNWIFHVKNFDTIFDEEISMEMERESAMRWWGESREMGCGGWVVRYGVERLW